MSNNVIWVNGRNEAGQEITKMYGNLWVVKEEYSLTRKARISPLKSLISFNMCVSTLDDPDYELVNLDNLFEKLIEVMTSDE